MCITPSPVNVKSATLMNDTDMVCPKSSWRADSFPSCGNYSAYLIELISSVHSNYRGYRLSWWHRCQPGQKQETLQKECSVGLSSTVDFMLKCSWKSFQCILQGSTLKVSRIIPQILPISFLYGHFHGKLSFFVNKINKMRWCGMVWNWIIC